MAPSRAIRTRSPVRYIRPPSNTGDALAKEQARGAKVDELFAEYAKKYSTCPSKANGGDLNFFPRMGAMVEPFSAAAFGLNPFQMSDVVTTEFGQHLILCTAKKPGQVKKFETPACAEPVKVYLGQRVKIRANVTNTVVTTIKGPSTRYGTGGRSRIVSGRTVFTFAASSKCGGRTAVEAGQIPQLFFHTMLTDMALGYSKEYPSSEAASSAGGSDSAPVRRL